MKSFVLGGLGLRNGLYALIYIRMDNASGLKREAGSKSANANVEAPLYYRFALRNDSFCVFLTRTSYRSG